MPTFVINCLKVLMRMVLMSIDDYYKNKYQYIKN